MADKFKAEIEKFIKNGDENIAEMKLKKIVANDITVNIMDSFDMKITFVADGKFKVNCEDSGLAEKVNAFCKSGGRTVTDILQKATSEFLNPEDGDEDDAGNDDEDIMLGEEDDDPIPLPQPKAKQDANAPSASQIMQLAEELGVKNHSNQGAVQHLLKTYLNIMKSDTKKDNYSVELVDKNLFLWHVKLYFGKDTNNVDVKKFKNDKAFVEQFESEKTLADDLSKYARSSGKGQDYVLFEVKYHVNHPFKPPFIRVLSPRFVQYTGHVTIGGSICFEFLTNNGWSPASSMETIIVQIRHTLIEGKARIDFNQQGVYSYEEAKEAFIRMANKYSFNIDGLI